MHFLMLQIEDFLCVVIDNETFGNGNNEDNGEDAKINESSSGKIAFSQWGLIGIILGVSVVIIFAVLFLVIQVRKKRKLSQPGANGLSLPSLSQSKSEAQVICVANPTYTSNKCVEDLRKDEDGLMTSFSLPWNLSKSCALPFCLNDAGLKANIYDDPYYENCIPPSTPSYARLDCHSAARPLSSPEYNCLHHELPFNNQAYVVPNLQPEYSHLDETNAVSTGRETSEQVHVYDHLAMNGHELSVDEAQHPLEAEADIYDIPNGCDAIEKSTRRELTKYLGHHSVAQV